MDSAAVILSFALLILGYLTVDPTSGRSTSRKLLFSAAVLFVGTLLGAKQLESQLDRFYIFNPTQLHDLSLKAIDRHGNDTKAVVASIVDELSSDPKIAKHVNVQEEWIFNNAGGAMGGMYIIHASKYLQFTLLYHG